MAGMKPTVLFVCVENSCRSQMAEGFASLLGGDRVEVWSAGSKPGPRVNATAIQVMKEKEIDLALNLTKSLEDLPDQRWDYVITMGCGDACPIVPSKKKTDWAIPDPKNLPLEEFRQVRDLIEEKVKILLGEIKK